MAVGKQDMIGKEMHLVSKNDLDRMSGACLLYFDSALQEKRPACLAKSLASTLKMSLELDLEVVDFILAIIEWMWLCMGSLTSSPAVNGESILWISFAVLHSKLTYVDCSVVLLQFAKAHFAILLVLVSDCSKEQFVLLGMNLRAF